MTSADQCNSDFIYTIVSQLRISSNHKKFKERSNQAYLKPVQNCRLTPRRPMHQKWGRGLPSTKAANVHKVPVSPYYYLPANSASDWLIPTLFRHTLCSHKFNLEPFWFYSTFSFPLFLVKNFPRLHDYRNKLYYLTI